MKRFIAVFNAVLFFCCFGYSLSWNDLEIDQNYSLNFQINFENFSLHKNEIWKLVKIDSESNKFIRFQMQPLTCNQDSLESELIVFETVGIKYDTYCNLNIYIEPFQYYDESLF